MAKQKLPFLRFFVGDWLSDECVRACSLEARAVWMDILCLMHKSVRRGYLQQANGTPYSPDQIGRIAGCSAEKAAHLVRELVDSGAASVTPEGVIYNRRMAKEGRISDERSEAGKKGVSEKASAKASANVSAKPKQTDQQSLSNTLASEERCAEGEIKAFSSGSANPPEGVGGSGGGEVGKANVPANSSAKRQQNLAPAVDIAQRFSFLCTKRKGGGLPYYPHDGSGCEAEAAELLRHIAFERIVEEIERDGRNRSEWFGDMSTRLCRNHANGTYHGESNGKRDGQRQASGRTYRYDAKRDGGIG